MNITDNAWSRIFPHDDIGTLNLIKFLSNPHRFLRQNFNYFPPELITDAFNILGINSGSDIFNGLVLLYEDETKSAREKLMVVTIVSTIIGSLGDIIVEEMGQLQHVSSEAYDVAQKHIALDRAQGAQMNVMISSLGELIKDIPPIPWPDLESEVDTATE